MYSTWWERCSTVPCNVYKKWMKQSLCVAETNNVSLQAKLFVADATRSRESFRFRRSESSQEKIQSVSARLQQEHSRFPPHSYYLENENTQYVSHYHG